MSDLHVHRYGNPDAPPLVLVHGLTDDGTCWPDAVERWRDTWQIISIDQRGHGRSPRFTEDQYGDSPAILRDDLSKVLSGLAQPAIVVGHSLGGLVAARSAQSHPELVRALVLEDPAKPSGRNRPSRTFSRGQLEFVEAVTADPEAEVTRMRAETPWSESELAAWAPAKARVDRGYLAHGLYLGDAAWETMFDGLRVPTLIVGPVGGEMLPDASLIANPLVSVIEVPDAGHCVRRDAPAAFHAVVDRFLEQHRP
ncbi:alpha/beta fold hydrolase [Tessaracoccus flavus]|uniref:Uncharacterized protein n=1 Tax=Tessaracoccus flavus TaxID=1610493 RepID=A0A1Q2CFJ8_9ACTN|nr:alpha/beta hydrolase [Tessaracoccus flavus]AQP44867.1 hypothetical protein RPIT_08750 [Tessaracoccus flavus]SDY97508.1 Pimeloyl-ACP methyl ester carboxylesterase [Tessaracoccus flavus]